MAEIIVKCSEIDEPLLFQTGIAWFFLTSLVAFAAAS
jgi:hypothetical protein